MVLWPHIEGGALDATTGAIVGGVEYSMSGTLKGFEREIAAETKLHQMAEIQMGDVLIDIDPDAVITIYPGQLQSGTRPLDELKTAGVRFQVDGKLYTQAQVGEELAQAWNTVFQDQQLIRTILLRKAT